MVESRYLRRWSFGDLVQGYRYRRDYPDWHLPMAVFAAEIVCRVEQNEADVPDPLPDDIVMLLLKSASDET